MKGIKIEEQKTKLKNMKNFLVSLLSIKFITPKITFINNIIKNSFLEIRLVNDLKETFYFLNIKK